MACCVDDANMCQLHLSPVDHDSALRCPFSVLAIIALKTVQRRWIAHVQSSCLRLRARTKAATGAEAVTTFVAPVLDRLLVSWSDELAPMVEEVQMSEGSHDSMVLCMSYS